MCVSLLPESVSAELRLPGLMSDAFTCVISFCLSSFMVGTATGMSVSGVRGPVCPLPADTALLCCKKRNHEAILQRLVWSWVSRQTSFYSRGLLTCALMESYLFFYVIECLLIVFNVSSLFLMSFYHLVVSHLELCTKEVYYF